MSKLDLEAIRARAANLAEVRAVGNDGSFAGLEPEQLRQVAQGYAADVPALLDRIAELKQQMVLMDEAHEAHETDLLDELATEAKHKQQLTAIVVRQREKHAVAMAVVRAVADAEMGAAAGSPPHHLGLVLLVPAMEAWRLQDQARALVAGETREEAGATDGES